jgi:thiosulfate/3-mercaptopyruvate sulfurtransferase
MYMVKSMMKFMIGLLVAFLICGNGLLPMQALAGMDEEKAHLFVDASWLKTNLTKVTVIDARPEKAYNKGHIYGAVSAPWPTFVDMQGKPGDPGWGVLLPKDQLSAKFGALGIDGKKPLVVYAQPPGWGEDGRVAWTAMMAGIREVKILDGGYEAWEKADGETSTKTTKVATLHMVIPALDEGLTATTDWIYSQRDRIKIVDSRSEKEFDGAKSHGEARGGHLPGAHLIAFETMFNKDHMVKSPKELKQMFSSAGLKPGDEIVNYCTAGIRSAYMAIVMRMVGFDKARNYDASFYEWAAMKELPME